MRFSLFHCEHLEPLLAELRTRLRHERRMLAPQKAQAVVVGNLETEALITRRFIAEDGILMGVHFPFLESAIADFCTRLISAQAPAASESWFLPPNTLDNKYRPLSRLDLEILLLHLVKNREGQALLRELGFDVTTLPPAQLVTLVGNLAHRLRESILHSPQNFAALGQKKYAACSTAEKLWWQLEKMLRELKRPFPGFDPTLPEWICQQELPPQAPRETLYLFGMPIISEYHIRSLVAIARLLPVEFYMVNLAAHATSPNRLLKKTGARMLAFTELLQQTCAHYGTEFSSQQMESQPTAGRTFTISALPGVWRAAELMGDEFHARLAKDPNLRQDEIGVSLTDPGLHFAAFERALGMRQLTAFAREKFYQVPDALSELWQMIAEAAQSGVSRALLVRYALNPLIAQRYADTPEKLPLYLKALEKAHGYRDDYLDTQSVFLISEALRRIERSMLIGASFAVDLPPVLQLGADNDYAFASELRSFLTPLLAARNRFADLTGEKLAEAMLQLQQEITPTIEAAQKLASWFDDIRELPGFSELSFAEMIKLMQRHVPGRSLIQKSGREGISFASLGASCFTRQVHLLFDLGEDAERDDAGNLLFPEIRNSPTRLAPEEQLAIEIVQALASNVHALILAYSSHDPATGAQKYPAQALADAAEAAEILGRQKMPTQHYPITIMGSYEKIPPIAAAADRKTVWLLRNPELHHGALTDLLMPTLHAQGRQDEIDLYDLLEFINNPAYHLLRSYLPNEPEIFSFRREEPRLAFSSDAKLLFCEDYLRYALFDAHGTAVIEAADFVRLRQKHGEYPPEGFDQAMQLLAENDNNARLSALAQRLQKDFTLVEYIFHAGVVSPFRVEERARLARIYLPAVEINGTRITGTSPTLLCTKDGKHHRLMSAIYPKRSALLVEAHLLLCLLALSPLSPRLKSITIADLGTKTRRADPLSAIDCNPSASLSGSEAKKAKQYLQDAVAGMRAVDPIFFDLSLIADKKLGHWATATDQELLDAFRKASENTEGSRSAAVQSFFALDVDERSVEFFKKFILPVAEIDRQENLQEKAKSETAGKATKKKGSKK